MYAGVCVLVCMRVRVRVLARVSCCIALRCAMCGWLCLRCDEVCDVLLRKVVCLVFRYVVLRAACLLCCVALCCVVPR